MSSKPSYYSHTHLSDALTWIERNATNGIRVVARALSETGEAGPRDLEFEACVAQAKEFLRVRGHEEGPGSLLVTSIADLIRFTWRQGRASVTGPPPADAWKVGTRYMLRVDRTDIWGTLEAFSRRELIFSNVVTRAAASTTLASVDDDMFGDRFERLVVSRTTGLLAVPVPETTAK